MNKVIEILEKEFNKLKSSGVPGASGTEFWIWNAAGMARHIYALIDPLREFPEEAVILCQKFDTSQRWLYDPIGDSPPKYSLTELITDLKRLWEGTELADSLNLDQGLTGSKGGCPTCGGEQDGQFI